MSMSPEGMNTGSNTENTAGIEVKHGADEEIEIHDVVEQIPDAEELEADEDVEILSVRTTQLIFKVAEIAPEIEESVIQDTVQKQLSENTELGQKIKEFDNFEQEKTPEYEAYSDMLTEEIKNLIQGNSSSVN